MKWDVWLAVVAVVLLLLWTAAGVTAEPDCAVEAIAEQLAPQLRVDEDLLRQRLRDVLRRQRVIHALAHAAPLALLTFLLVLRVFFDAARVSERPSRRTTPDCSKQSRCPPE